MFPKLPLDCLQHEVYDLNNRETNVLIQNVSSSTGTVVPAKRRLSTGSLLLVTICAISSSVGVTSVCPQQIQADVVVRVPKSVNFGL